MLTIAGGIILAFFLLPVAIIVFGIAGLIVIFPFQYISFAIQGKRNKRRKLVTANEYSKHLGSDGREGSDF